MGDIFTSAAIAWGVVALLFLITELMTGTLYVLCVFVGALAASFVPLFGGGFIAQVAVDGDDWKAESVESEDIPVGSKVEVLDRKSLILTVKTI